MLRDAEVGDGRRRALLWAAVGCMTIAITARTLQLGTVPLLSAGEALYFYAWLVFLVYLVLMPSSTKASVGALLVPFGTVCSSIAVMSGAGETQVNSIFQNPLFALHTLTAFLGYSALSVACCAGILYLMLYDQVSNKRMGRLFNRLPPLEDLDRLGHRTVLLGFALLTVAIITGGIWARTEWGVNWILDPKAVWTFFSWLIYAVYLGVRRGAGWRGVRAAWIATTGFVISIMVFLGTNFLLGSGKHLF